jgi:hypothetical protein
MLVIFVQQQMAEKRTGIVASAQKRVCKDHSNKTIQEACSKHSCFNLYFLVLKNFKHFILYNCIRNEKSEQKRLLIFN